MRILVANDGLGDAGGVQSYLGAVVPALRARGHALALVHRDPAGADADASALPQFSVAAGLDAAMARVRAWRPDVVFSHNMNRLDVERSLAEVAPIVKFMHGYFGTCIGGLKHHGFPSERPCDWVFGAACLALYLPRHCGQMSVVKLARQYQWARGQRALFPSYRALVVASEHMRREYVRHGVAADRVHANALFPTHPPAASPAPPPGGTTVAFLGRMTPLKGGDVLIRAAAAASRRLPEPLRLLMIGDGPVRPEWERLASSLGVAATFIGWQDGDARWRALRAARLLAVPSVWPEPFGLVGLEASALGVPAMAFDVGGVREWLHPGRNGFLVAGDPPTAGALGDALEQAFRRPGALDALRASALEVARELSLDRHLDRLEPVLAGAAPASDAHPVNRRLSS